MASITSSPKPIPVGTNGIVLIHMDFLLTGIVMTFLGPMLPMLSARWGLSDSESGSLIFAQFFSSMFGMLASGILVQRLGYRLTLILGLLLMALGTALLASGPWLLGIVSVCIMGIGYGATTPAANLRTAEHDPSRSASALNILNSVWGIGAMSSPFLVALAQRAHRPSAFFFGVTVALLLLLLALALSRFIPDTRAHIASSRQNSRFWKIPIFPLVCVLFFIYVGTETSFGGWVATYAHRIETVPHAFATLTPSFYWGALLAGRALAPFALRFHVETSVAKAGLTIALLGGLSLVAAHGTTLVVAGALLAGLGLASIFPISVSLLRTWFGDSSRRASGAIFASGNLGGAIVPWIVGLASTRYSSLRLAFFVPLTGVIFMLVFYLAGAHEQLPQTT